MFQKSRSNIFLYAFLTANLLPILAVFADIWEFRNAMYIYWFECALVALLAVAMYAKYLIVFFALSAALASIVYMANPDLTEHIHQSVIFWTLYSLSWLGYVEIGKSTYGKKIRQLKPQEQLGVYFCFMAIAIVLCFTVTGAVSGGWIAYDENRAFYHTLLGVAIIVPTISIGLVRIIDMIGEKHFIDFLLGTYLQSQERNSVVLFLDMVGSSAIAEKLEAKKSMDLIAQFIYDCGYIFRIHGGDILNYTGDGLVVLWPRKHANRALAAVQALRSHFMTKKIKSTYWKKYGMVPDFRIGIHAGPTVISQIGEEKLFLGLYGDVVNTAARLEQMNKQLKTYILLSEDVVQTLNQSWKTLLKPLGEHEVRGRDEKVKVYTIYQQK